MLEDKLTQDQRLRLECIAQANVASLGLPSEIVIEKASKFENYIRNGKK